MATDIAPPPYETANGQNLSFTDQALPPDASSSVAVHDTLFPTTFSVYNQRVSGHNYYTIGERKDHPLYCVTLHGGLLNKKPDVILHGTRSEHAPPLATANRDGSFSRNSTVMLPVPGALISFDRSELSVAGLSLAPERLESAHSFGPSPTFSFTLLIEPTKQQESFVWRHTRGDHVQRLGGDPTGGWKLVRDGARGVGTSDGHEVVAVWSSTYSGLARLMAFEFVGSGATGELGMRWAVMAVITALKLWDREMKNKGSGPRGVGGGGIGGL